MTPQAERPAGKRPDIRLALAAFALLLLAAFGSASPAAAATAATFGDNTITTGFPDALSFHVVIESDAPIQQVELYWHAADSQALSLAYPDFTPGNRVEIDHEIDMSINYLPPGIDIAWFWRVTDSDGVVSESEPSTALYMDQRHDWRSLTDGPVTLYWYEGSDSFGQDIVDTANRAIDRLRDRFQVSSNESIRLVIYGSNADFAESLPANSAEWIGGQAYSDLRLIVAGIDPDSGARSEIRRMVPHEVSHLILYQATLNPFNSAPTWLDEGLAVYNQETVDDRLAPLLARAVEDGKLSSVRALNSSFPLDPTEALLSYAESESIVSYIIDTWGDDGLGRLLGSFRQEMSYDEAVESSLNVTIEQLDAQWKQSLGYQGNATPVASPGTSSGGGDDTSGTAVLIGAAVGLAACAIIVFIVAFVLVFRARRRERTTG